MHLKQISLQNFRSYAKETFNFSQNINLIIGPNTAGKSNLIEAIFFLATGRSFRIDKDDQLIKFGKEVGRIGGKIDEKDLEVIIAKGGLGGSLRSFKKYLVNLNLNLGGTQTYALLGETEVTGSLTAAVPFRYAVGAPPAGAPPVAAELPQAATSPATMASPINVLRISGRSEEPRDRVVVTAICGDCGIARARLRG